MSALMLHVLYLKRTEAKPQGIIFDKKIYILCSIPNQVLLYQVDLVKNPMAEYFKKRVLECMEIWWVQCCVPWNKNTS